MFQNILIQLFILGIMCIHICVDRGKFTVDPGKKLVSSYFLLILYSMHLDFSMLLAFMDQHIDHGMHRPWTCCWKNRKSWKQKDIYIQLLKEKKDAK